MGATLPRAQRVGQHPDLPGTHTGKDDQADDDHTKTKTIPPDHHPRHALHMDRHQGYRNNSGYRKTDYQLIDRGETVKPGRAIEIVSHGINQLVMTE